MHAAAGEAQRRPATRTESRDTDGSLLARQAPPSPLRYRIALRPGDHRAFVSAIESRERSVEVAGR